MQRFNHKVFSGKQIKVSVIKTAYVLFRCLMHHVDFLETVFIIIEAKKPADTKKKLQEAFLSEGEMKVNKIQRYKVISEELN